MGCFLYTAILANADPETGIWIGSAGVLSNLFGLSPRTCRDNLEKLESMGYVRRFQVQGRHIPYPILVDKYEITIGAMKGKRLNCEKSISYSSVYYEWCRDGAGESAGESAAIRENIEKEEKKEEEINLLSPSAPGEHQIRPEEFANVWNRLRGKLPKVEKFTDGRRKKVLTRIRQGMTLDRFTEAVENCRVKPFLLGENSSGWTVTFDWLIGNAENSEKAINNPYGLNRPQGGNHVNGNGKNSQSAAVANLQTALRESGFEVCSDSGSLFSSGAGSGESSRSGGVESVGAAVGGVQPRTIDASIQPRRV